MIDHREVLHYTHDLHEQRLLLVRGPSLVPERAHDQRGGQRHLPRAPERWRRPTVLDEIGGRGRPARMARRRGRHELLLDSRHLPRLGEPNARGRIRPRAAPHPAGWRPDAPRRRSALPAALRVRLHHAQRARQRRGARHPPLLHRQGDAPRHPRGARRLPRGGQGGRGPRRGAAPRARRRGRRDRGPQPVHGPRLLGPARADGGALPRRAGGPQRAPLPDRRPRPDGRGRVPGPSRPEGLPGEDPRQADRAGGGGERRSLDLPSIREAAVVARTDRAGESDLVAYVVPEEQPGPGTGASAARLPPPCRPRCCPPPSCGWRRSRTWPTTRSTASPYLRRRRCVPSSTHRSWPRAAPSRNAWPGPGPPSSGSTVWAFTTTSSTSEGTRSWPPELAWRLGDELGFEVPVAAALDTPTVESMASALLLRRLGTEPAS